MSHKGRSYIAARAAQKEEPHIAVASHTHCSVVQHVVGCTCSKPHQQDTAADGLLLLLLGVTPTALPHCCGVDTFSAGRAMSAIFAMLMPHLNVGAQKWTAGQDSMPMCQLNQTNCCCCRC
jgi:hypothetical protein